MGTEFWYVLICRCCNPDLSEALPIPFPTAEARGRWASEHTAATGHDSWAVVDQPKGVSS